MEYKGKTGFASTRPSPGLCPVHSPLLLKFSLPMQPLWNEHQPLPKGGTLKPAKEGAGAWIGPALDQSSQKLYNPANRRKLGPWRVLLCSCCSQIKTCLPRRETGLGNSGSQRSLRGLGSSESCKVHEAPPLHYKSSQWPPGRGRPQWSQEQVPSSWMQFVCTATMLGWASH